MTIKKVGRAPIVATANPPIPGPTICAIRAVTFRSTLPAPSFSVGKILGMIELEAGAAKDFIDKNL